jgi:hypothetical protein
MFCSGCGQALGAGQAFCPTCGKSLTAPLPPVPGMQFLLDSYGGKIRILSICWFIYEAFPFSPGLPH